MFNNSSYDSNSKQKIEPVKDTFSIAVWSPVSAGATTIAASLFLYLNRVTDKTVTIIDADIYKPEIDCLLDVDITPRGIDKKGAGSLNFLGDAIAKGTFKTEVFEELTVPYKRNGIIITGNTNLSECENVWCGDEKSNYFKNTGMDSFTYYEIINKKAMECSQIVIYDLSSSIFMDSTKYFLNAADYNLVVLSAKQSKIRAEKYFLEHAKQHFKVDPRKTFLLINKYGSASVEKLKMKEIFKGWTFLNNNLECVQEIEASGIKGLEALIKRGAFQEISERLCIIKEKKIMDYIKEKIAAKSKQPGNAKDENDAINF